MSEPALLTIRSKDDVAGFVASRPSMTGRTKMLTAIALLSVFADGYDLGSLGLGIASLRAEMHLTAGEIGLVSALTAVGALVSSLIGGYVADRTGRFKLFVIVGVALVVTPIGAALAPNFATLAVFRFLMGVAVGLDIPVAFSFMAEFGRHATRGRSLNLWQPLSSVATIVAALVVLVSFLALGDGGHLWRWAVAFGAFPMLIVVALRLRYAEESPVWVAANRGLEQAGAILEKSYGVHVVIEPGAEPPSAHGTREKPRIRALFSRKYRARTVLSAVITSAQSLQYYAVGFYTPVIAGLIFGADIVAVILSTIAVNLVALVGGSIQPLLTHRLGLWKLAAVGFSIVALAMLGLGLLGDVKGGGPLAYLAIGLVAVLLFGHTFGPGPVSKTMPTLSYPTEIRGMGTGMAETVGRIGTIVGLSVVPVMLDSWGQGHTLLLLAVVPIAALATLATIRWDPLKQDVEGSAAANAEPAKASDSGC
ncbi:MFS transporter [Amycolatopsis sp. La24]|uniref:MFS transporter n=1 Tax=Amycolatopsis sp. La24 TaxID=3028304 RepID=UPI0023B07344|nr:MFS transporter [Amycolatopsis sp. La24]